MWPFGRRDVASRLAAAGAAPLPGAPARAVSVSVLTTIVSPNAVESPLTGARAAVIRLELFERFATGGGPHGEAGAFLDVYEPLGVTVLGDLLALRDEDGDEISIVARRARIQPARALHALPALGHVPPELVPLLAKATGRGVLCYREAPLVTSDSVLLTAHVEPASTVVAVGYRSGTRRAYVARDDLAPILLDEVLSADS